jgi:hypothetical protein
MISTVVALARALRSSADSTPEPDWAASPSYALASEVNLRSELLEADHQLTEACGWGEPPRYIIRDRDGAYGDAFIRRLTAHGRTEPPDVGSIALAKWTREKADRIHPPRLP